MRKRLVLVIILFVVIPLGMSHAKTTTDSNLIEKCAQFKHGLMMKCINQGIDTIKAISEESNKSDLQALKEMADMKNPYKADKLSIEKGGVFYRQNCSGCHGATGKGNGEGVKDFGVDIADLTGANIKVRTDGELMYRIVDGGWPMPAFGYQEEWSRDDLWHVINFIRTLSQDTP